MRAANFRIPVVSACHALAATLPAWGRVPPGEGTCGSAAVLPADVHVAVRVRDVRSLRSDGSLVPAQAALARLAGSRVLGDAWQRVAATLGTDGFGLLDLLFGADVTYAERERNAAVEWAIVTRCGQPTYDLLVKSLGPKVEGGGRVTFAEHGVAAAWRPPFLLLGSAAHRALLDDVVARIDAAEHVVGLADDPAVAAAAGWDRGAVEVVWRHPAPTDGTSVFVARSADGVIRVRHRSAWQHAPIHVAPGAAADVGALRALQGQGIAVLAMNQWRGEVEFDSWIDPLRIDGAIDDAMRANLGAREVMVVGERPAEGSAMRVPTVGIAYEVRDPLLAERQWDGWARRLASSLAQRTGLNVPEVPMTAEADGVHRSAMAPLVRALFADHPLVTGIELSWATAATPANGAWQLVATDPALLRAMREAIAAAPREPDPDGANEVGILSGRVLAEHLRTWVPEASRFAPESAESFAQAVRLAADVASAATLVRWRAKAPDEHCVEGEIVVELPKPAAVPSAPAAPPSAPAAPSGAAP
jgi:hypothetical protein